MLKIGPDIVAAGSLHLYSYRNNLTSHFLSDLRNYKYTHYFQSFFIIRSLLLFCSKNLIQQLYKAMVILT